MEEVYVLIEEYKFRGVYSSLEKAIKDRDKLTTRAYIKHCILDDFVNHEISLKTTILYPGEEPKTYKW